MKTTETVDELGVYSSECCSVEVTFEIGDTFSRCPKCHSLCVWDHEDEVIISDNSPEPGDGIAA